CLATTIILKMQLKPAAEKAAGTAQPLASAAAHPAAVRRPAYALVTLLPLLWLLAVTMTAGLEAIFHHESNPARPRIGFLQKASELKGKLPDLTATLASAEMAGVKEAVL